MPTKSTDPSFLLCRSWVEFNTSSDDSVPWPVGDTKLRKKLWVMIDDNDGELVDG